MLEKKQRRIRKINFILFTLVIAMIVAGQYIRWKEVPSLFVYYYGVVALTTLIAFILTLYDIAILRKNLLSMIEKEK